MADQQFLNLLGQMKAEYIPEPQPVSEQLLVKMEDCFTRVGAYIQQPNPHSKTHYIIQGNIWLIAEYALDGLNSDDYATLFESVKSLHAAKNAGYAGVGAVDHWANFRMAEWFGVSAFTGCLVRMTDKFIRVKNLYANPQADQVNESIKDTLYDLAIYCLIAICLWNQEKEHQDALNKIIVGD